MNHRRDERGVSAILFALMLTTLLIMSSMAVDFGSAYTERRHDQNAADAAVMSAVVESVLGGGDIEKVVAEVDLKVETTLGHEVTDEEWSACKDGEHLEYTTVALAAANDVINPEPLSECISFSADFARVRVKLPPQDVLMLFAPSLGLPTLTTSAAAEAEVVNGAGTGAPPFVALSTAVQGDFICLRTSSSDQQNPDPLLDGNGPGEPPTVGIRPDPCDDSEFDTSSSNFGTLAPFRYLDDCTQQNATVETSISIGIDHIMGFFPDGYGSIAGQDLGEYNPDFDRIDGGPDKDCLTAYPNTFEIDTGLNASGLRCALISLKNEYDCNSVNSRFHQGDYVDWSDAAPKYAGENLDLTAPWDFLRPAEDLYLDYAPDYCVVLATFRDDDDTFDNAINSEKTDVMGGQFYIEPVTGTKIPFGTIKDGDWDPYDRFDALKACLEEWDSNSDPELFTVEIGATPRFAFIPRVAEADLTGKYVHIVSFLPTFMFRLYQLTSTGDRAPCDPIDPRTEVQYFMQDGGADYSCARDNQNVDRLSSIILSCGMVPDELCNKETNLPVQNTEESNQYDNGQDIYEFRLVK